MGRVKHSMFEANRDELEAKYHEMGSCKRTAEYYGTSGEIIRRCLIKYGIQRTGWKVPEKKPLQRRNQTFTENEVCQIIDAYERTKSIRRTAAEVSCSVATVMKYLQLRGRAPDHTSQERKAIVAQSKITDAQLTEACKTMTDKQIADKYGMSVERIRQRRSKLGLVAQAYAGLTCGEIGALNFKELNAKAQENADKWHYSSEWRDLIEKKLPDFEFVSYRRRKVRLRCKHCGEIMERDASTVRQKKVWCRACNYQQRKAEEERQQQKQRKALMRLLIVELKKIEEKKKPKTCQCCGNVYYSESPKSKWCPRCKALKGNYHNRARKYGAEYEHGISLRKVFIRDKGICQICGKPTDWHDYGWGNHFGPNYPTIDHIVALANGGSHTWDNVQLAHAICNSYKRDLI